ncbi:hypothetical protein [French Guiana hepevirus]|nr:hypothetical protein [French Guiana hepevirus]
MEQLCERLAYQLILAHHVYAIRCQSALVSSGVPFGTLLLDPSYPTDALTTELEPTTQTRWSPAPWTSTPILALFLSRSMQSAMQTYINADDDQGEQAFRQIASVILKIHQISRDNNDFDMVILGSYRNTTNPLRCQLVPRTRGDIDAVSY